MKISAYEADIRTTSHDMLLLYSGSSDIEVGPLLLKLQHIFDCRNSVLHPLVERTSEDLDGMLGNGSSLDHEAPPIRLSEPETRISDPLFSGKDLHCAGHEPIKKRDDENARVMHFHHPYSLCAQLVTSLLDSKAA